MDWSALREKALSFFFPRRCPFCGRLTDDPLPCPRCQRSLPWLMEREAEGHAEFVSRCVCALRYQGEVARAIRAMKFHGRVSYAATFGLLTAQCVQDHLAGRFDLVTWVPLAPEKLASRGYDQSELLAREVAKRFHTHPVRLFAKRDGVAQQSTLRDFHQRRANVLGAYRLLEPRLVRDRRVLIIDDIITTGATISECGRLLRLAGAADVTAAAPAMGGQEREKKHPAR